MSESKTVLTIRLDASLYDLIAELAAEQRRTPSNFVVQFLRVSLERELDRAALVDKMNPSLTAMRPAIEAERERLAKLGLPKLDR